MAMIDKKTFWLVTVFCCDLGRPLNGTWSGTLSDLSKRNPSDPVIFAVEVDEKAYDELTEVFGGKNVSN